MEKANSPIILNGFNLTIEDIVSIGRGKRPVRLDPKAVERCRSSRQFLEETLASGFVVYGVNTSFGPMCNKIIEDGQIEQLQTNLIRSHAAGLGPFLSPEIARASLTVRLNTLAKGASAVRVELLRFLEMLINSGVAPCIPECGSVGASGDLIHLAHLALAVIGEGQVFYNETVHDTRKLYYDLGIKPLRLSWKEGLSLINGTSVMTAIGAFALHGAQQLLNLSCVTGALAIEIFGGINDSLDEDLHMVKPHPGQLAVAGVLRGLCNGSNNIIERGQIHGLVRQEQDRNDVTFETSVTVQDVYSIRCTPQILAPVQESITYVQQTLVCEANSANDNPLVIPEKKKIIHGGNFHGQSISFAMDILRIAVSSMCNLSERRLNKLLDKHLNQGLPEHLIVGTPGVDMGFMGAQYLATSTTAENRQMANPISTLTISCNASNQDVVSMGTVSARKSLQAVGNAKHVLTLEVLAQLQAAAIKSCAPMGYGIGTIYAKLKEHFRAYDNQRTFYDDLVQFRGLLFSEHLQGQFTSKIQNYLNREINN